MSGGGEMGYRHAKYGTAAGSLTQVSRVYFKLLRHDADNHKRHSIQTDRLADDVLIATKQLLPGPIVDDGDGVGLEPIVARNQEPSENLPGAERLKEVARHKIGRSALDSSLVTKIYRDTIVQAQHIRKCLRSGAHVSIHRIRIVDPSNLSDAGFELRPFDLPHEFGVSHRGFGKKNCVQNAEQRGIRANADRERDEAKH